MTNKIGKTLLNLRKWRILRALVICYVIHIYAGNQLVIISTNKEGHMYIVFMWCFVITVNMFYWMKFLPRPFQAPDLRSFRPDHSRLFFFWGGGGFQTPSGNGINFTFLLLLICLGVRFIPHEIITVSIMLN